MEQGRYTPTYRPDETAQVMSWIQAGQCGSIIGLRGAGKSNFLRFLLFPDVRQQYLGSNQATHYFVFINLLSLSERTEWGVYEMIINGLMSRLSQPGSPQDLAEALSGLHQGILSSRDDLTSQRAVERGIDILCQEPNCRLVLLFDEFDAVFRDLSPALFRSLRSIRDNHKDQVLYLVVTACDLDELRSDLAEETDHFYRLVRRNVCALGPYNDVDTRQMIRYLAAQRCFELDEKTIRILVDISGGHAGLLKATLSLLWNTDYKCEVEKLAANIQNEPTVQRECWKIWNSLSGGEQVALCTLATHESANPQAVDRLLWRGLVRETTPHTISFFSPIFATFVARQSPPPTNGTLICRSPRIVQLNGQRFESLTEMEFEVLYYLYEHHGQVCTKDDLVENVYRQRYGDMQGGVTDEALQALISRLREKIEPDRSRPQYVVTVRGEGYKFSLPVWD
jgi:DNA-binding winged helix-turn-helix (wHTH) protein